MFQARAWLPGRERKGMHYHRAHRSVQVQDGHFNLKMQKSFENDIIKNFYNKVSPTAITIKE